MELEFALAGYATDAAYPFAVNAAAGEQTPYTVDWGPMILDILRDLRQGLPIPEIAGRFHNTMADIIVDVAHRIGERRVALSGGCFQNAYLSERTVTRLRAEGFLPYWHQRVPPNDGGISLGQIFAFMRAERQD
jgi:hydrogenase maturation protein HypF